MYVNRSKRSARMHDDVFESLTADIFPCIQRREITRLPNGPVRTCNRKRINAIKLTRESHAMVACHGYNSLACARVSRHYLVSYILLYSL